MKMSAEHIIWEHPTQDERRWGCDGYVNDAPCMAHPTQKDPRDGGLYCDSHAEAIDRNGVDGRYLRAR